MPNRALTLYAILEDCTLILGDEPGSSECWSDALTEPLELWHWSRGYTVYIHRHSSILRLVQALLRRPGFKSCLDLNVFFRQQITLQ